MTRIRMATARTARLRPIRPSPTIPSVLPRSAFPGPAGQPPSRIRLSDVTMVLARPMMSASACSATASWFAFGVTVTTTPRSLADFKSTLSKPTPIRAMTLRSGSASITPAGYRSPHATVAFAPLRHSISSSSLRLPCPNSTSSTTRTSNPRPSNNRIAGPFASLGFSPQTTTVGTVSSLRHFVLFSG